MRRQPRDETTGAHRIARLTELLLGELRAIFRDDIADPSLAVVEVTAAVLSPDYRHLRVYCTCPGRSAPAVAQRLPRAKPFVRARLVEAVDLKRAPEIDFVIDRV
jgi:ribosome-binding factor A